MSIKVERTAARDVVSEINPSIIKSVGVIGSRSFPYSLADKVGPSPKTSLNENITSPQEVPPELTSLS